MSDEPHSQDDAPTGGLSAIDAARRAGVKVTAPGRSEDGSVQLNGLTFHYLDWGNAHLPDLLFLHGTAQQAHSWDFASLALRDRFHVVALDQRGHGDSGWDPDGRYTPATYLSDTRAFVGAAGLNDLVICGLSLGGRNAYSYAAAEPGVVRALVVVDAAPRMEERGRDRVGSFVAAQREFDSFDELVSHVHSYLPHRPVEQIRGSLQHTARRFPNGKWAWKYDPRIWTARRGASDESEEDRWRTLSRVVCPTLFVLGGDSEMVAPDTVARMLTTVPGSRAETVQPAGHLVPGDNPAGFDAALRPFLDALPARLDGEEAESNGGH